MVEVLVARRAAAMHQMHGRALEEWLSGEIRLRGIRENAAVLAVLELPGRRVGTWAAANNVEIAYTPTNSSWLNRIEAQLTTLRYFTLDGTDHASHKQQASMIRRYIIWRNSHAYDERLRRIVGKANIA
jgi:hypothetical protein